MRRRLLGLATSAAVFAGAMLVPTTALASNPCTGATSWWAPSDSDSRWIVPPNGSGGSITSQFNASWKRADLGLGGICYAISGTSKTSWLGSVPFNANKVQLVDQWHTDGIAISLGIPGGVGFSGTGSTIKWSTSLSNVWTLSHNFVDVWFTGLIFTGWWEQATGYYTFGGDSFNVNSFKSR
jgi:hypothetical protein